METKETTAPAGSELDANLMFRKAACLLRGRRYLALEEICEQQKTISTVRLRQFLAEFQSGDCEHARYLTRIAGVVRDQQKNHTPKEGGE